MPNKQTIRPSSVSPENLDLIAKIYDLPLKPENWHLVLDNYAAQIGSVGATIYFYDPAYAQHHVTMVSSNYLKLTEKLKISLAEYNERYAAYDEKATTAVALYPDRGFVFDQQLQGITDPAEYDQHPPVKFLRETLGIRQRAASRLNLDSIWSDLIAVQYLNNTTAQQKGVGEWFVDPQAN